MKIVRFKTPEGARYGLWEGDVIFPLRAAPWETGGLAQRAGEAIEARSARLLVPVTPSKILGIGRNYRAHAAELGNEPPKEPMVFLKAPSSLLSHRGTVLLPAESSRVDFEGELALVIGRRARHVPRESWRDVVCGITCALDITARDLQKRDGQWWRAKGYDTFCPLGPAVDTEADPADLLLETRVDGRLAQSARTSAMLFDVGTLVAWVSSAVTLEPGDVILTGTPEGVGPLVPGQRIELTIENVGALEISVASASKDLDAI
jgi:2-keto-4-pentenoate hydratase/2-oxohepta-3-ene-1,7-dioic acid hydratase in catechol pathway